MQLNGDKEQMGQCFGFLGHQAHCDTTPVARRFIRLVTGDTSSSWYPWYWYPIGPCREAGVLPPIFWVLWSGVSGPTWREHQGFFFTVGIGTGEEFARGQH